MRHHGPVIAVSTSTEVPVDSADVATAVRVEPPAAVRDLASAAVAEEIGSGRMVGAYLGAVAEDDIAMTVSFAATDPGYAGWQWSVTVAVLPDQAPTVSEVVLLPGSDALLPPHWVPWEQRVRPGDLGVGDLLPAGADDPRLVPAYVASDDPEVERVALELGLGRVRVMSRDGRADAAERWHEGAFGPAAEMALAAPAACVSCGFYLPLAGSLGAAFGVCGNEISPADGRVVDSGYGCGAHSETDVSMPARSAATDAVIDELVLDVHARPAPAESAPAETVEAETVEIETAEIEAVEIDPTGLEPVQAELVEAEDEAVEAEPVADHH